MASSSCVKCGGRSFQLQQQEPGGSRVKWFFVQCTSCGVPVGVIDFYPNSAIYQRVEKIEESISNLASRLSDIDLLVRQIHQRIR